jgi:MFS family permease
MLSQAGYGADFANLAFGGTWLFATVGAYALGGIADRFGVVRVFSMALFAGALGTLMLLFAANRHIGLACVAMFVVLWGGSSNCLSQFMPVILVERFGNERLGTLLGVALGASGIVGPIAPLITGLMYDRFGDYRVAIYFSAIAAFIASGLIITISTRRLGKLDELPQRNSAAV